MKFCSPINDAEIYCNYIVYCQKLKQEYTVLKVNKTNEFKEYKISFEKNNLCEANGVFMDLK